MKRNEQIDKLKQSYDIIVIGGGATGAMIALDAVSRGYEVLLLEGQDFAKGTSSRSTKLLHGGVRYLQQGNIALVKEALKERNQLLKNASNLSKKQVFIIPTTNIFSTLFYFIGLKIYDFLAGKNNIGRTKLMFKNPARKALGGIKDDKLKFGIAYYDGCFDDARMAFSFVKKASKLKACVLNYAEVINLLKNEGQICGVEFKDKINNKTHKVLAKCVINATGVFASNLHKMDDSKLELRPSQGVHIVLDKEFFPSKNALMIPKTSDGRVLFAIPWHSKVLVGTTDTPIDEVSYEPKPLDEEIDFILKTAKNYLAKEPTRADIKSVFAGLRPLINDKNQDTKNLSRSHKIDISPSKLVSINGGKYTTTREMAEQTIDAAINANLLDFKPCKTLNLSLGEGDFDDRLSVYDEDKKELVELESTKLKEQIHKDYPYTFAQVFWAIRNEMAMSLEDILARRIRLLFIDAKACKQCARSVCKFVADELKWSEEKQKLELESFLSLVKNYQVRGQK